MNFCDFEKSLLEEINIMFLKCKFVSEFLVNAKETAVNVINNSGKLGDDSLPDKMSEVLESLEGEFTYNIAYGIGLSYLTTSVKNSINDIINKTNTMCDAVGSKKDLIEAKFKVLNLDNGIVIDKVILDNIKGNPVLVDYVNSTVKSKIGQIDTYNLISGNPGKNIANILNCLSKMLDTYTLDGSRIFKKLEVVNKFVDNKLQTQIDQESLISNIVSDFSKTVKINEEFISINSLNDILKDMLESTEENKDVSVVDGMNIFVEKANSFINKVNSTLESYKSLVSEFNPGIEEILNKIKDLTDEYKDTKITEEQYADDMLELKTMLDSKLVLLRNNIITGSNLLTVLEYVINVGNNLFVSTYKVFNMVE